VSSFHWDWAFAWSIAPALLMGAKITIVATLLGSLLSFVLGLIWTLLRLKRITLITPAVEVFVSFVRGTPLLAQLYFVFYVFPKWGLSMPALVTGIVGLGIYYSATASEIYRAGIEELAAGQWEAALVLGLPIRRVWLGIVLPQAVKTVLPVLGNQVVAMFKETSLLSTITVIELLAEATSIGSINFRYVEPLTMAGFFYFVISYTAARGIRRLEAEPHVVHG
jgi:polar amino acid transport system permease protein